MKDIPLKLFLTLAIITVYSMTSTLAFIMPPHMALLLFGSYGILCISGCVLIWVKL